MNQVQLNDKLPAGLTAAQLQKDLNSRYSRALAMGDPRFNMKQLDRGGLSRGAAQRNQAGIDAAQNVANGVAEAYGNDLTNRAYNSSLLLQGQTGLEQQAQALGGLQQQNNYANQMAGLQRQQMQMNLFSSLLGGLLK